MSPVESLLWSLGLASLFILPLIVGAFAVEYLAPKSRAWIRRLRKLEQGRRAQAGGGR